MAHKRDPTRPIAIIGMGLRLPGGISTPDEFWDLLINKKDGQCRVPTDRYNIDAFYGGHSDGSGRQRVATEYGYFLKDVNFKAFDTSFFTSYRAKVQNMTTIDPRQRLLLEVVWECMESAGQTDLSGSNTGVYVGVFGHDWNDLVHMDTETPDISPVVSSNDFTLSSQLSHAFDLRGPSMTLLTACSSTMTGLHLACQAIRNGDCSTAIVAGANIMLSPSMTLEMSRNRVLSPNGACRTFDAAADGYARGEAFNAVLIKPLEDALRDGDPVRAVIRSTALNGDGATASLGVPSPLCHEIMIRRAYEVAGISDFSETPYVECHGTGTRIGDLLEVAAVTKVFGGNETFIGSVKPNLGHSEGASGLSSVIKAVLALERETIPPNINYSKPNPKSKSFPIPFEKAKLQVPLEPTPWPKNRHARVSVNSFGIGGANAHVILDSAASFGIPKPSKFLKTNGESHPNGHAEVASNASSDSFKSEATSKSHLLPISASTEKSLRKKIEDLQNYIASRPDSIGEVACTLGNHRINLPYRTFCIHNGDSEQLKVEPSQQVSNAVSKAAFVFTGQGAQWAKMGKNLISGFTSFRNDIQEMDRVLQSLDERPTWKIEKMLCVDDDDGLLEKAEIAQPLCVAMQVGLVNLFTKCKITPIAVIGHSSGEIAAAYAAGAMSMAEAIICGYLRGQVTKRQSRHGGMAAVNMGKDAILPYLVDGVQLACVNSSRNVTISGDEDALERVVETLRNQETAPLIKRLHVNVAYHSDHMREVANDYEEMLIPHLSSKEAKVPFYSTVTGHKIAFDDKRKFGPGNAAYWRDNLSSPVLFQEAMMSFLNDMSLKDTIVLEIGPHPTLQGPINRILQDHSPSNKATSYIPTLIRQSDPVKAILTTVGRMYTSGYPVDFSYVNTKSAVLTDLPNYPWDRSIEYWSESRVSKAWRFRTHRHHELLGARSLESNDSEPAWRNILRVIDAPWLGDHRIGNDIVFPCAGYVAMLGEAIRQVTGSTSYTLRNLVVKAALIIPEENHIELMTSLRPLRLTDHTNSRVWYEFTIASFNGTSWVQNCISQGRTEDIITNAPSSTTSIISYPRRVSEEVLYDQMRHMGMNFGPRFQGLRKISAHTTESKAVAEMQNNEKGHEATYSMHPLTIDLCFQLCAVADTKGIAHSAESLRVPTNIGRITVKPGGPDLIAEAVTHRNSSGGTSENAKAVTKVGNCVVIDIENARSMQLDIGDQSGKSNATNIAHVEWCPDIDFLQAKDLIQREHTNRDAKLAMEKLAALCILQTLDLVEAWDVVPSQQHLMRYISWLQQEKTAMAGGQWDNLVPEAKNWASSDSETLTRALESNYEEIISMGNLEVSQFAKTVRHITEQDNIVALLSGNEEAFELIFNEIQDIMNLSSLCGGPVDVKDLFHLSGHAKPTMRVLDIGAARRKDGDITERALEAMVSRDGIRMFSEYVLTDTSSESFTDRQEQLKNWGGLQFKELDISSDPVEQGFELGAYDLIIAANAFYTTASLPQCLRNVCALLRPGGRLLLQEMILPLNWRFPTLVMGLLPRWWDQGISSAATSILSIEKWSQQLLDAGLSGVDDAVVDDDATSYTLSANIFSNRSIPKADRPKAITLIYNNVKHTFAQELASDLANQGIGILWQRISDPLNLDDNESDFICTMDLEGPFFHNISEEDYKALISFLSKLKRGVLWLTRSAQLHCTDPRYGLLTGLARNIRLEIIQDFWTVELQQLDARTIAATSAIFERFNNRPLMADRTVESEFAVHEGVVYTGRYHWVPMSKELEDPSQENSLKHAMIDEYRNVDSLHWAHAELADLKPDQVELAIRSVGLNFRDIMIAMGFIEGAKDVFGFEASAVVTRVGTAVSQVRPGDRALTTETGLFATQRIVNEKSVVTIPDELSFEDAATIPIVYMTAIHALLDVGQCKKGQSVLIHSACGGVGQAAINICKMIGAEIYTTVGNEDKVQYLMTECGISRDRIFNSRNASFVDDIMRSTGNRGVDMVLNSLSGDLLHASWECVAKRGKMLEIGKRDMLERGHLGLNLFQYNRSFHGIDLDALCRESPEEGHLLMRQTVEYCRQGYVKPIRPIEVFEAHRLSEAFRYLQKGQHMGKIIVSIPTNAAEIPATQMTQSTRFSPASSYILVGGLGGIGKAVASWMVEQGARSLIFMSRSAGKSDEDMAYFDELKSQGCDAVAIAGSVVEMQDVKRAIAAAPKPISGVIQMSMVANNGPLVDFSHADWNAVQDPKVQGTWNLHNALLGTDLDFFLLFSSLTAVLGLPFQANYASANTFLVSFMQYRHSLGLPCSALDLGVMESVGFVSGSPALLKQYRSIGAQMVRVPELLNAIQVCIQKSQSHSPEGETRRGYVNNSQIAIGLTSTKPLSDPNNPSAFKADIRLAMYHRLDATTQVSADSNVGGLRHLLNMVAAQPDLLDEAETLLALTEEMGRTLCGLLLIPRESLDINATLTSMGVDSLFSIEIRNWWRRTLGTDVSVLEIMNTGTVEGLGRLAVASLKARHRIGAKDGHSI